MMPTFIWLGFSTAVAALCMTKPQLARVLIGCLFLIMALAVNLSLTIANPNLFVEFAEGAYLDAYGTVFAPVISWQPRLFGAGMVVFELVVSGLILSRGAAVRIGLVAAIIFLLAIVPLGPEELPNLVLAIGLSILCQHEFEDTALATIRSALVNRKQAAPPVGRQS